MLNTAKITQEEIKAAPTSELVETYNIITGKSIKKFADRNAAERLTWKAIEMLAPGEDVSKASVHVKAKKETVSKREDYDHRTIKLLVEENPKRPGSRAHEKFGVLMKFDGKSIGEYKAQEGKHPKLDVEHGWPATEIRWSLALGLVKIVNGHSETKAV